MSLWSAIRSTQTLSTKDCLSLEWLLRRVPASQHTEDLISVLTLFFYHQSQSQIGLMWDRDTLEHWRAKLILALESTTELPISSGLELAQLDLGRQWPTIIGGAGTSSPLVLDQGRLYSQRLWSAESILLEKIPERLLIPSCPPPQNYAAILSEVLELKNKLHARQAAAVALAPLSPFFVISGGPGTGKTSVLVHVLRTWLRCDPTRIPDDIVLCAPTGKAKARLRESLIKEINGLPQLNSLHPVDRVLQEQVPKSQTLHQLLYQALNAPIGAPLSPIRAKLVVVDEVSMVDLGLFKLLLQSLPQDCQLLLMGDMYQLPSVEHGAVLGDLTGPFAQSQRSLSLAKSQWLQDLLDPQQLLQGEQLDLLVQEEPKLLRDFVVQLNQSFRSERGILDLAQWILDYGKDKPIDQRSLMDSPDHPTLHFKSLASEKDFSQSLWQWYDVELQNYLIQLHALDLGAGLSSPTLDQCFKTQAMTRVLCMQKRGMGGVQEANEVGREWLSQRQKTKQGWIHGEPVIMTQNNHLLELYNGDCGIIIHQGKAAFAVFCRSQGYKMYGVDELSGLESAFGLTIHKSQGSEYEHPLLLIPFGHSNLASKEILYTGVTRAKSQLTLLGDLRPNRLAEIAGTVIERPSRLREFLNGVG